MNKELKPCPFCGGEADWYIETKDALVQMGGFASVNNTVECDSCGITTPIYADKSKAIKAWNTRIEK